MHLVGLASLAVAICYLLLQVRLAITWKTIEDPGRQEPLATETFVTVIVPMRNEENNILSCIHSLIAQDYPAFEILVLDNHSSDDSADLVEQLDCDLVRLIRLDKILPLETTFKKEAIELGVSVAQGEIILATDADCVCPPGWITTMVDTMQVMEADYVVGPIRLMNMGSGFLKRYQSLVTDGLVVATGSGLESGLLLSSFGANHGFLKNTFTELGGYDRNRNFRSGDDIFLVQEMKSHHHPIKFVKNREAIVTTQPLESWLEFLMQNVRWVSKGQGLTHQSTKVVSILSFLICLCLILLVVAVICYPDLWTYLLVVFLMKVIADTIILRTGADFNQQHYTPMTWMLAHLFQPILVVAVVIASLFLRPRWKQRSI